MSGMANELGPTSRELDYLKIFVQFNFQILYGIQIGVFSWRVLGEASGDTYTGDTKVSPEGYLYRNPSGDTFFSFPPKRCTPKDTYIGSLRGTPSDGPIPSSNSDSREYSDSGVPTSVRC